MSVSFRQLYGMGSFRWPVGFYGVSFLIFNVLAPVATVNERIIVFSTLFGILWLDPIRLTLRKEHRKNEGFLGMAFLFAAVSSFIRVGGTLLYEKDLPTLLDGGLIQQVYVIAMGLELFLFLAGYSLMLNARNLERILSNEATLRAAIDHSPYGMVMTDRSGQVIAINATFEKITGYALSEIQQGGLQVLLSADHKKTFFNDIWHTLLGGRDWDGEFSSKRKDGSSFWEKAVWSPIRMADGQITGFFGVTADVTQKRQLEDFKNEIEHLMRHDLKTPLNAVINLPDIIQSEGDLNSEQQEFLNLIRMSGESMLEQINYSLEMYRLEEGSYRTQSESLDLREVLSTLCGTLLPMAQARSVMINQRYISLEIGSTDTALLVSTVAPLFRRLVGNLLKNAVEASPDHGAVEVRVTVEDGGITIAIHNAGAIPVAARSRFFTKFNTSGKCNGTGLGSYGAKLIADTLGYALDFVTDDKTGTTLTIGIPQTTAVSLFG